MNVINFQVEHHCPSCGAPVYLDEADRFFVCPYCRVRSCIDQKGFGRFFMAPHEAIPKEAEMIFMPYWRFKGVQYACTPAKLNHWFTDVSCLAAIEPPAAVPYSLGFRSQALTLKRVSARTPGTFLRPKPLSQCLAVLSGRGKSVKDALITEDIGEAVSLIYSPVYVRGEQIFDGVLNTPLGHAGPTMAYTTKDICRPEKETRILSGICPNCSWDLEGQSDSLVLICRNCDSLWQAWDNKLVRIRFGAACPDHDGDALFPFWKIGADISGMTLNNRQDLMALANLPGASTNIPAKDNLYFWTPAFKIRPKIFLRIARQVTLAQPDPTLENKIRSHTHMPITLPANEAIQSIRLTLASLARPLKDHLPMLANAQIKAKTVSLIFLPFEPHPHEFIHQEMNLAINNNVLRLSGNL
ncbi:MAG: hypothetical protein CSA29_02915 [Desulfobacterales bacterium]|nr:MAG: hypothetical protein CSA29_02915 [Desulfobacterales bacterium]